MKRLEITEGYRLYLTQLVPGLQRQDTWNRVLVVLTGVSSSLFGMAGWLLDGRTDLTGAAVFLSLASWGIFVGSLFAKLPERVAKYLLLREQWTELYDDIEKGVTDNIALRFNQLEKITIQYSAKIAKEVAILIDKKFGGVLDVVSNILGNGDKTVRIKDRVVAAVTEKVFSELKADAE